MRGRNDEKKKEEERERKMKSFVTKRGFDERASERERELLVSDGFGFRPRR